MSPIRNHVRYDRPTPSDPKVRTYIGILGLFPMVTATVMAAVQNLTIAAVIAGLGAVTCLSLLPRGYRE